MVPVSADPLVLAVLPDAEQRRVRALADRAAAADGVAPLSEQPLLWLDRPVPGVHHLISGTAGYAQVDLRDPQRATAELVVDPGRRRQGVGTALLSAVAATARRAGGDLVQVWAHGDLPAARALAAARGLTVARELWQMRLDPLVRPAPVPLPAGLTVRPFRVGADEDAWLRLNTRAFAHHPEQGRLTRADLADRIAEPWFDPAGLLLAERDGRLLAAGWTKVPVGSPEGEIYVLGVDPDAQGQGLGRLMTGLMLDHLADRGLASVVLYTEGDNTAAVRTYTRAGFTRSAVDIAFHLNTHEAPSGATMG